MIVSYRHKGLKELFEGGKTAKINKKFHERVLRRLDALNAARVPEDMNVPGFNFHALQGHSPTVYTVHVNGPWSVDFEFDGENAANVDFTNHH
jgi:proteic killer suppression protein